MKNFKIAGLVLIAALSACNNPQPEQQRTQGDFARDITFLKKYDSVIVLKSKDGQAQVIVSPKYQGKVFTSTATGMEGKSFGWINYKAFDAKTDEHMNAYGGEDRLWLGPEGNRFSLYFKPGTKMEFANWHTPAAIDHESWQLVSGSDSVVVMSKNTEMLNYAGTKLRIKLERRVRLIKPGEIQRLLGIDSTVKVNAVAYSTANSIQNTGNKAWDKTTGAPCLWNLDMFTPSPKVVIVVPYNNNATGKVATTDYFGQISPDRVKYINGILLFKADGKSRGKLGMPPNRAKNMAGSYDPVNRVLTITQFKTDSTATYLNQEWNTKSDPFKGDAVNAYNDGPLATGGQMGPFFEIESVSPAAFLKPGEKLDHYHNVYHFTGDEQQLNTVALKTLGISLKDIQAAFK